MFPEYRGDAVTGQCVDPQVALPRFSEVVAGVPVLDQWGLTKRFRSPKALFVS